MDVSSLIGGDVIYFFMVRMEEKMHFYVKGETIFKD